MVSTAASSPNLRTKLTKARANTLQDGTCPTVRALYIHIASHSTTLANDTSDCPPTSPQHRCSYKRPYRSRRANLALSFGIHIRLHGKAAAASGSFALSCRKILTDSALLSYTIRTRKFRSSKLYAEGLEAAAALLKSIHFFWVSQVRN